MKIAKFLLCVAAVGAVALTGCSSNGKTNESTTGTTVSSVSEGSSNSAEESSVAATEISESETDETSAEDKSETSTTGTGTEESSETASSGEEKSGETVTDNSEKKDSGSDESKPADNSSDVFSIKLSGKTVTLPCLAKELDQITIDEDTLFSAGEYCTGYFSQGKNKEVGNIFFESSEDDKEIGERTVIGLDFSPLNIDGIDVEYRGLRIGDTADKIKSVLGEPDEVIADADKYYDVKYKLDEKDENKCVIVGAYDGVVNCISLYIK